MAVQSTGIVWATNAYQNGVSGPQWQNIANGTGAPDQTWASRAVDNTVNDLGPTSSLRFYGIGPLLDSILPPLIITRGIKVHVVRKADALTASDSVVGIMESYLSGGLSGDNRALTSTFWPNVSDPGVTQEYGGEDDLWNYGGTWLRAVLVQTGFGIALGQQWEGGSGTIYIDAVGIEIFYDEVKTTGALFPATASSTSWANPNNAKADDTSYATRTFAGSETPSVPDAGIFLSGFGAAVPAAAEIVGIQHVQGRFSTTAGIRDRFVQLHQNGSVIGANKWVSGSNWGTGTTGTATYGGNADLWSTTGLTGADVNASTFGIVLEARNNNASARQGNYDFGTLEFFYIEPGSAGHSYGFIA